MSGVLTVITPATNTDIVTPADVMADGDIDTGGNNSVLYADIHAVSAAITGFLGRDLALQTYSQSWRQGCGTQTIFLARFPVVEILSASEAGAALSAQQYEADSKSGALYRITGSDQQWWVPGNIVVVYKAGYLMPGDENYREGDPNSIPADIQKAAVIACKALWNSRGRDPMVKSESVPGVIDQEFWVGTDPAQGYYGLPLEAERLLRRYCDIYV